MVRDRQHGPVIELNRIQVKRSRSKGGLAGPDGIKSVFGQMVTKMSLLTQEALFLPHRVWKVKFVGKKIQYKSVRVCLANGVSSECVVVLTPVAHVKMYRDWWCGSMHSGGVISRLGCFPSKKRALGVHCMGVSLEAAASKFAVEKRKTIVPEKCHLPG
jgi:hypothetical protein